MRVLLVEPAYRKGKPNIEKRVYDDTLWYPPLSLLKLARFHKERGDDVKFVSGYDPKLFEFDDEILEIDSVFDETNKRWDRIYITTLFTFHFEKIVKTINNYKKAVGGTVGKIFIGGIMESLMPDEIHKKTGIYPVTGLLNSPEKLLLTDKKYFEGDTNIDTLSPYYEVLENFPYYAINETFYGYTSRGCTNKCGWCGVPKIEPDYIPYIDIKPMIHQMREECGDKPKLKLMDNNVLASKKLKQIVNDLLELGYGRGELTHARRQRIVDFNQGLDATFLTEKTMKLLSKLNIKPMRIAFDRIADAKDYERAIKLAHKYSVKVFSNYILFNWNDSPKDLFKRLEINIGINEQWREGGAESQIYSYPMRFAPIKSIKGENSHHKRDYIAPLPEKKYNLINKAVWTKRFIRNISVITGAAHGAIPTTPTLARRAIGHNYEEFLANLYMPEVLLRYRNKHERKVYPDEPPREPGTGLVEEFRDFILTFLKKPTEEFWEFHEAISKYNVEAIRKHQSKCKNKVFQKWLKIYSATESQDLSRLS